MKTITIIIFVLFIGCNSTKEISSTCSKYKNGRFINNVYNNSGLGHWKKLTYLYNRQDSIEVVISNNPFTDTTFYKIEWINSCKYQSTYISGKNAFFDSLLQKKLFEKTRTYEIVKANDNYYLRKRNNTIDTFWLNNN